MYSLTVRRGVLSAICCCCCRCRATSARGSALPGVVVACHVLAHGKKRCTILCCCCRRHVLRTLSPDVVVVVIVRQRAEFFVRLYDCTMDHRTQKIEKSQFLDHTEEKCYRKPGNEHLRPAWFKALGTQPQETEPQRETAATQLSSYCKARDGQGSRGGQIYSKRAKKQCSRPSERLKCWKQQQAVISSTDWTP